VEEEPRGEQQLYRVAHVVPMEDPYADAERERVARLRASILENVGVLLRSSQPEQAPAVSPELFSGVDDPTLVNLLSNALALPAEEKQGLLEADTIPDRYARLASLLSFQRAEIEAEQDPSRGSLH
jgi:Lon protease-like protein